MNLAKAYSHKDVEEKWYKYWSDLRAFQPSTASERRFAMVIPPPNVTGSLHMGHALNNTLQDILCRYKRMDGCSVLWVPGTDHAGIATQNVIERQLAEKGLSRTDLGRERFIERVWSWRTEAGSAILHQLKALGVSCDWSRERFTMDEGRSRAVREAFVRLWVDGLLYRAERLINWCPRCKTALADIEVVHEEIDGHLWYIRYPLADDPSQALIVATTRPETMLGDTAVAVHPEDKRYQRFVGRKVSLPIVERPIPVIADPLVDQEFGTGALKITPGHDFNDFEIGERYGLGKISIFDADARIDPAAFVDGKERPPAWLRRYQLKDRSEARRLVIEELEEKGFLEKVEPYRHALGRCYRCQTVTEPYLTPQWFVRIKPLAEPAIQAVREGKIRIVPEGWANSYFAWMENIKDWTISRQIWWGHQIPAWYCRKCDASNILKTGHGDFMLSRDAKPIVQHEAPNRCPTCGGKEFVQDPDVLDTWFSSALWPFSTLGWPEKTADLRDFYPTSVLVTGFDILFFWVSRMIMMGLKFMGDVPFRDVYIHALVRDQEGQKMSKSKGNVIDPLEVMDRYGTDAFRFTLASLAAMGRDIKLAEERIAGYQNFVNKLWNAARFVFMNLSDAVRSEPLSLDSLRGEKLNLADQWILSRLNSTIREAREAVDSYRFNEFAHHLYQFTWHEFCDWYIEMSKLSLNGTLGDGPQKTQRLLAGVLEKILLLLHPLMPYVTEEIWHVLKDGQGSIMVQPYPTVEGGWIQPEVDKQMGFLTEVTRAIRNLRSEMNCPPSKEVKVILFGGEPSLAFLRSQEPYLRALARAGAVEYLTGGERPKGTATAVIGDTEIYLPLEDMVNLREEKVRLAREVSRVEEELARVQRKLGNGEFLAKAKEEVIRREREKAGQYQEKIRALHLSLQRITEVEQSGGKA
ncbi:MAG: valine--tRNA ligase [Deltaproteobacteria bacterium]|nr:valine--tRNA ligase [Deltaproteobacteria bacterium]